MRDTSPVLSPCFGDPVALLFKLLQFSSYSSEHHGQIAVDGDLLEEVAIFVLHILRIVNHFLKVRLLRDDFHSGTEFHLGLPELCS